MYCWVLIFFIYLFIWIIFFLSFFLSFFFSVNAQISTRTDTGLEKNQIWPTSGRNDSYLYALHVSLYGSHDLHPDLHGSHPGSHDLLAHIIGETHFPWLEDKMIMHC